MRKLLKKALTLSLCACMVVGMATGASAATKIASTLNENYVVNVSTWGTPVSGNAVTTWTDAGGSEQRWNFQGTTPNLYFRSAANASVTLACGSDYLAYMETYNPTYGDWQQHRMAHNYGTVYEFPNKGAGYYQRLMVGTSVGNGSRVYYGYPGLEPLETVRWKIS